MRPIVKFAFVAAAGLAVFVAVVVVGLLFGCGGAKWTADDATNATDIANAAASLEAVCERDGGMCPGSSVRAVNRGIECAVGSMLYRHAEAVPDAGIVCRR